MQFRFVGLLYDFIKHYDFPLASQLEEQSAGMLSSASSQALMYPPIDSSSTPLDSPSQDQILSPSISSQLPSASILPASSPAPPSDQMSYLSLKRKSMAFETPIESSTYSTTKGKDRADSLEPPSKLIHLSSSADEPTQATSPSVISQSPIPSQGVDNGAVFVDESGVPLKFFVQIHIQSRAKLVQTIKVRPPPLLHLTI